MIPPNAMLTEGGPWNRGAGLRLSDLALTIFYLTGPLLIISELVLPEISIPDPRSVRTVGVPLGVSAISRGYR